MVFLPITMWLLLVPAAYAASLTDPTSQAYDSFQQFRMSSNYTHQIILGENDDVALFWTINDDEEEIHLGVAAGASGWVGFGVSDVGGMKGADIVVYEAGSHQLTDYYSLDYVAPTVDSCPSDWSLLETDASQGSSFIVFEATRKLDTGDAQDWPFQDDSRWDVQATKVIVAWGDEESLGYHGSNRASTTVRFFAGPAQDGKSGLDHLEEISDGSFLVTTTNYAIPVVETTYYDFCADLQDIEGYPQTDDRVYVVGADFVNSVDNNGVDTYPFVHHFIAEGNTKRCGEAQPYNGQSIFYAWGPGQQPLIMPEDVGIPLGGDSLFQSLGLQIHYNNPDGIAGLLDSTGIRVFYVLKPPKHEAATMITGDGVLGLVGQEVGLGPTMHRFTCPSTCTSSHFSQPVTVFAEAMHQHGAGQRGLNQVIRNNRIVHQASVEVWDYPQGGLKIVQQAPYEIQPGDIFRTYCYYNNANNPSGVSFGLGTQDEMCQAFLMYYPAISTSHGFCGVDASVVADDTNCNVEHVQMTADPDFGRLFGAEPKNGCDSANDIFGVESESAAPTIFLGSIDTAPTKAPTYSSGNPICHICGEGSSITLPDALVSTSNGETRCSQIRDAGLNGFIEEYLCATSQIFLGTTCGCSSNPDIIETNETKNDTVVAVDSNNTKGNDASDIRDTNETENDDTAGVNSSSAAKSQTWMIASMHGIIGLLLYSLQIN